MVKTNPSTGEAFCKICGEPFMPEEFGESICPDCEEEIQDKANEYAHNKTLNHI